MPKPIFQKKPPLLPFLIALSLLPFGIAAQCPPAATPSVHVVQKGENLFRISLKYGLSVADLCAWNGINEKDMLPTCKKLFIIAPLPTSHDELSPKSGIEAYQRQSGNRHVVRPGETVEGLAKLYGYAEWRFRRMNNIGDDGRISPGNVLVSEHCSAESYSPSTPLPSPDPKPSVPKPIRPDANLKGDDEVSPKGGASQAPYMTAEEWGMVEEINLLRQDPAGYIIYIKEYRDSKRAQMLGIDQAAVSELIDELQGTPALPVLRTSECIQGTAEAHGLEIKAAGTYTHKGKGDTWPWDRVRNACSGFQDGNENFVAGPASARQAIIKLLIDEGISGRGHRRALLNPHWTHVACYEIGVVGGTPHAWLQKFGQE